MRIALLEFWNMFFFFKRFNFSLKLTARPWKWMVGRLFSVWDGLFSKKRLLFLVPFLGRSQAARFARPSRLVVWGPRKVATWRAGNWSWWHPEKVPQKKRWFRHPIWRIPSGSEFYGGFGASIWMGCFQILSGFVEVELPFFQSFKEKYRENFPTCQPQVGEQKSPSRHSWQKAVGSGRKIHTSTDSTIYRNFKLDVEVVDLPSSMLRYMCGPLCAFSLFAVPETMVTRLGLASAFFDLLPVKSWIDFLVSSSSFGHYKKTSGLIYFDKFQLQPHQHPPWNSTTINKKWCFRLDDDTYSRTWKLVEPCKPTYKTWQKNWTFQGPLPLKGSFMLRNWASWRPSQGLYLRTTARPQASDGNFFRWEICVDFSWMRQKRHRWKNIHSFKETKINLWESVIFEDNKISFFQGQNLRTSFQSCPRFPHQNHWGKPLQRRGFRWSAAVVSSSGGEETYDGCGPNAGEWKPTGHEVDFGL